MPLNHQAPPDYEKDRAYAALVGSVFKLPKEGGQFLNISGDPPAGRKGLVAQRKQWPGGKVFAENATAIYPGIGSTSGGVGHGCTCRQPGFHVDGYGRLALANAVTFKVRFVDNTGNDILEVGKYGNLDAVVAPLKAAQDALPADDPLKKLEINPAKPAGINALLKAKPLPASEVAFGWPESVAVSERSVYVADVQNHCIVRLDKTYANEETCGVK
jgi:hypothetical protein